MGKKETGQILALKKNEQVGSNKIPEPNWKCQGDVNSKEKNQVGR